jgi:two-component system LytT family response regulator
MKLSALIIDDEYNNIENLSILLGQHCPDVGIAGHAVNADDARGLIAANHPDLVFLDIQMPGKSGFDLLRELDDRSFEVIFITAYDKYGIQAVKFAAIDYLLKPVDIDELKEAVRKVEQRATAKMSNSRLDNLINLLNERNNRRVHRIALQGARETRFVEPDKIVRCESSNNYTTFFLADGDKIVTSRPIFEYEELLKDYDFIRPHQSHLVNKQFIRSWVREDGGFLLLENNFQVPVSRSKREEIRKLFA